MSPATYPALTARQRTPKRPNAKAILSRTAYADCLVYLIELKLFQQSAQPDPGALVADADADRAILVMNAQGGDAAFKAGIGHAWHREQQLSGEKRRVWHRLSMPRACRRTSLVGETFAR